MRVVCAGFTLVWFSLASTWAADSKLPADPIRIGSRLELLVDDSLIESLSGEVRIMLHHPMAREVVLVHDEPWEGSGCGYHSVFQDGDLYRMYYKAWHLEVSQQQLKTDTHPLFCCYAESNDGVHWRKPELGLHDFEGSKQNNLVIVSGDQGKLKVDAGHPAVFKDDNPHTPPEARYKAVVRSAGKSGLIPMKSPDGIHFSPLVESPILVGLGAFDSQNLAFWDQTLGKYRAYWRIFTEGVTNEKTWKPGGYRAIRTATSDDLIHWSRHVDLTYFDSPQEQLYTNQIKPYFRAPHILLGFPTRYVDRGWSDSARALPELEHRQLRASANPRYGTAVTEALFMASRDGVKFKRYNEAFLRPGIERTGAWNYGQQYVAWHVVETDSALEGAPPELSLYATESYWTGRSSALRRYTLRMDGFVSAEASAKGGELLTKPLLFAGDQLRVNFATSAAGSLQVEIQNPAGKAIEGFALQDSPAIFGDSIERKVSWTGDRDLGELAGQPVRLRWVIKDANLYAFQFRGRDE